MHTINAWKREINIYFHQKKQLESLPLTLGICKTLKRYLGPFIMLSKCFRDASSLIGSTTVAISLIFLVSTILGLFSRVLLKSRRWNFVRMHRCEQILYKSYSIATCAYYSSYTTSICDNYRANQRGAICLLWKPERKHSRTLKCDYWRLYGWYRWSASMAPLFMECTDRKDAFLKVEGV